MAYIGDLTIILHRLFLVHSSGVRNGGSIGRERLRQEQLQEGNLRRYLTFVQTFLSYYCDNDPAMEKIIDLIEQYCCTYTKQ